VEYGDIRHFHHIDQSDDATASREWLLASYALYP